ncbi:MAG: hypothetical protein KUG77_09420, partial [Nannocystaceae bacterium]|nr:hypothetical protein [Nannocystaceae bacterium]
MDDTEAEIVPPPATPEPDPVVSQTPTTVPEHDDESPRGSGESRRGRASEEELVADGPVRKG